MGPKAKRSGADKTVNTIIREGELEVDLTSMEMITSILDLTKFESTSDDRGALLPHPQSFQLGNPNTIRDWHVAGSILSFTIKNLLDVISYLMGMSLLKTFKFENGFPEEARVVLERYLIDGFQNQKEKLKKDLQKSRAPKMSDQLKVFNKSVKRSVNKCIDVMEAAVREVLTFLFCCCWLPSFH